MNKAVDVSFVMPCLNEAATIKSCVDVAQEAILRLNNKLGLTGEIIVADNGSTDGSQELAKAAGALVVDINERGYGAALRGGFAAARGRYFVMGDADMSYDFREAVPMIEKLEAGSDLCMGSRFLGEIKPGAMPWKNRYIGNPVLSAILRLLFKTKISDSHCGLRAISREALEGLKLSSSGMEFASEMVLKSSLKKLKMSEVPVTLSPDGRGRPPHLSPWRDGFRHLFYMFMLSPTWLFLAPSAFLFVFGISILALLLANPDGQMVRIGNFGIGDHWSVVGSSSVIIATQTIIGGAAAMIVGIREGYMVPTPFQRRFLARSTLSNWLGIGLLVFGIGVLWTVLIAAGWLQSGFGELDQIRSLIAAFTTMVVGVQLSFGGFLLSVVAGNKMKHRAVLNPGLSEN
jgi:glycosyltransferase involved in cell wall biosynthesis